MMKEDEFVGLRRCRELQFKPLTLHRIWGGSIRLIRVAVDDEKVHRPLNEVVIPLVARQIKEAQIRRKASGIHVSPIVISRRGEEPSGWGSRAVRAGIAVDEVVVIFA